VTVQAPKFSFEVNVNENRKLNDVLIEESPVYMTLERR